VGSGGRPSSSPVDPALGAAPDAVGSESEFTKVNSIPEFVMPDGGRASDCCTPGPYVRPRSEGPTYRGADAG
jgi:hypothetical protein